jgi:hypothetical protein
MSRLDVLSRNGATRAASDDPARPSSDGPCFWERVAVEWAERVLDELPSGERAVLPTKYDPVVALVGHADGAVRGWPTMKRYFARVSEAIEQGRHGRVLGSAADEDGESWAMIVLPMVDGDHAPLLEAVRVHVVQGLANRRGLM